MSDNKNSKAEKLAAAKKKLKEFKSTKIKKETQYETENNININSISNQQMLESTESMNEKQNINSESSNDNKTYKVLLVETQSPVVINDNNVYFPQQITNNDIQFFNQFTNNNPNSIEPETELVSSKGNIEYDINSSNNKIAYFTEDIAKQSSNIESLNQISNHINSVLKTESQINNDALTVTSAKPFFTNTLPNGLEQRNQELAALLSQEKIHNQELNMTLSEQKRLNEEYQLNTEKLKLDNSTKYSMDIGPLQDQLQAHIQTVGILVGEKAELTASLGKYQTLANSKATEVEELQGRLNASRYRVQELEKEITNLKGIHQKFDDSQLKLCSELENKQDDIKEKQKLIDEKSDEITELKQKLHLKNEAFSAIQNQLIQKSSELNMSQLKIEQLTSGDIIEFDKRMEAMLKENLSFQHQIQSLNIIVTQLRDEREQSSQQYQTYAQHLNKETTNLAEKIQELSSENVRLSKREEALIKHIGDLERQIQQQLTIQKNVTENTGDVSSPTTTKTTELNETEKRLDNERMNELQQQYEQRHQQCLSLQLQLQEKLHLINDLESTIERIKCEQPDTKNLIATIESDKVAASRAVSQNQDLKRQLEEMENAYIQLSNDKLELTNKLQSEQHLGREIKLRFNGIDSELATIKETLHFKDEEMIRLTHENTELNKQILQLSQELDHSRHYDVKNQSDLILQQKLQLANDEIIKLRQKHDGQIAHEATETMNINSDVHQKQKHEHDHNHEHRHDDNNHEHHHDHQNHTNSYQQLLHTHNIDNSDNVSIPSTINIATNEAMEKLQQRFTRTMAEIADLTEEKQRLEHLVLQLHGETETIGEYITLYQTQRRLLKQREFEKDIQLQRIASDREEMQVKLLQLNRLVEDLLLEKNSTFKNTNEHHHQQQQNQNQMIGNMVNNNNKHELLENDIQIIEHLDDRNDHSQSIISNNNNNIIGNIQKKTTTSTTETATKILTLLSDIKEKNLKPSYTDSSDINHHCSCCSGKLQTV